MAAAVDAGWYGMVSKTRTHNNRETHANNKITWRENTDRGTLNIHYLAYSRFPKTGVVYVFKKRLNVKYKTMMSWHTKGGNTSRWRVPFNNLALAEPPLRHLISGRSPRPPLDLPSSRSPILPARSFLPIPPFMFPLLLSRPSFCLLRSGRRAGRCDAQILRPTWVAGAPQDTEATCSSALAALFLTAFWISHFLRH